MRRDEIVRGLIAVNRDTNALVTPLVDATYLWTRIAGTWDLSPLIGEVLCVGWDPDKLDVTSGTAIHRVRRTPVYRAASSPIDMYGPDSRVLNVEAVRRHVADVETMCDGTSAAVYTVPVKLIDSVSDTVSRIARSKARSDEESKRMSLLGAALDDVVPALVEAGMVSDEAIRAVTLAHRRRDRMVTIPLPVVAALSKHRKDHVASGPP